MITLNSVSKELGKGQFKTLVLDDINWTVERRRRTVILGQRGSGTAVLLDILAGLSLPTRGWVERRATTSVPGGFLRYAKNATTHQLVVRIAQLYGADPRDIIKFVNRSMQGLDIIDVPVRQLPGSIRSQLNMALTYAVPCDFYLFNGTVEAGRNREFRTFCRQAFAMRSKRAGTVLTVSSSKMAAGFGEGATGGVLFHRKLTLYKRLEDAIAVFDNLPPDETGPAAHQASVQQEVPQEEEDIIL